ELDKHIVGQQRAKRAVAVALRNRWRRQHVAEPLRSEIAPKNILMIGPTGVGKTEIARRLARLADAPFIKVEATKFTEVGYVGRDVEIELAAPSAQLEVLAQPGMEELTQQIQSMFQNLGSGRRRTRKLKVREALRALADEEAARLVNDDELKLRAIANVEANGIVF